MDEAASMRGLPIVFLIVALAGCASEAPEPEVTILDTPDPVPQDIVFHEEGELTDGANIVYPFHVDPRVRSILVQVTLGSSMDLAQVTNDVAASLMHNGTFVTAGGNQGASFVFGNGANEPILYYEVRPTPDMNTTDLAGDWELRFSASGVQFATYDVDVIVRYV